MSESINPERSETERTLWHTLDEAGWSADQIRESFAAYRAEVLREAAAKIRQENHAATGTGSHATVVALRSHGDRLADVIDPL